MVRRFEAAARDALLLRRRALLQLRAEYTDHALELRTSPESAQSDAGSLGPLDDIILSELNEIVAALERIDTGTYGRCNHCNRRINAQRLEAVPSTAFCFSCAGITQTQSVRPPGSLH